MAEKRKKDEIKVLNYLKKNSGTYFKQKTIARNLNISHTEYPEFKQILKQLSDKGKIQRGRRGLYRVQNPKENISGIISYTTKGFAFVATDEGEEVFIGTYNTANAFHKDKVLVEKLSKQKGKTPEGRVVQILERSKKPVYGILKKQKHHWEILPETPFAPVNIMLDGEHETLHDGRIVELKNLKWRDPDYLPTAEIKQEIGSPSNPADDFKIVQKMFNLPEEFSDIIQHETQNIQFPNISKEITSRYDLREEEIFTIDPDTAKDFDDAISLQKIENDQLLLGVHIADVSYFVLPGSHLDREALSRSMSSYLGDNVIPMLPEKLSNDLCSLKPNTTRLAFSIMMKIDSDGVVTDYQIKESIIRSKKRFAYSDAQKILDDKDGEFYDTLKQMDDLAKLLFKKRSNEGSINFDLPEPVFEIGEDGIPKNVTPSERLDTHKLVEEFMLLANRTIAEHIALKLKNSDLPFLYRIHEKPSDIKIEGLYEVLKNLGLHFEKPEKFRPLHLQQILNEIQNKPFTTFVEQISLRSMSKAIYSIDALSHFGLAFKHYTHFTSPIRRYPDLIVHRLLKLYIKNIDNDDIRFYSKNLPKVAKLCSENEINIIKAEREYIKMKQIRFMANKIGEWYKGVITGVMEFGFFVEISDFLIEGLVPVRTLEDDYYIYDQVQHCLKGRKYNRIFRLGDRVNVKVQEVSIQNKRIDFIWGE